MKCDEEGCYEMAMISIKKDLFGKSDATRNSCSKHAPRYSAISADPLLGLRGHSEDVARLEERIRTLAAELAMLSDKACAAVVAYRAALGKLTDGFKYPTEVVTIARNALAHSTEFASAQKAGDTNG